MTTNYYTVNGRIIGESTGGVRTNYLPDALGSVTATVDESGAVVNTYRYKPAGAQLSKTGVGADPKFLWNGANGYLQSVGSLSYVRARHYDSDANAWTSINSRWPDVPPYSYAAFNPITYAEPSLALPGPAGESGSSTESRSARLPSPPCDDKIGNCSRPHPCPGGNNIDNGKQCYCKGEYGTKITGNVVGSTKVTCCSGSGGTCPKKSDCDHKEVWHIEVRRVKCLTWPSGKLCNIGVCMDKFTSKKSTSKSCGCKRNLCEPQPYAPPQPYALDD